MIAASAAAWKASVAALSPRRTFLNWSVDSSSERALAPGPTCGAWSESAEGPRLSTPARGGGIGRIAHALVRVVEALAVLFALVGALALAVRLSSGPIYLEMLHDKIATSLQERAGEGYAVELGPTYIMHNSWGVGLGFRRLTVRDAEGRIGSFGADGKDRPRSLRFVPRASQSAPAGAGWARHAAQGRSRTGRCR